MDLRSSQSNFGYRRYFHVLGLIGALFAMALSVQAKDYATVNFKPAHLGGMEVSFNIILPQDYDSGARRYPVLYLLHGYTGHYSDWVTRTGLTEYARHYEEIIVMPEGENGWYVDNYTDPKLGWQSYIIDDLIPYVDSHYRTVASRSGRAIAGLSMGGYGAMLLGLKYHQMFAAAASLSGALASAEPAFEMPQLYLSVGSSDPLLNENREFVRILAQLKIPYRYCEVPGKHGWPVWDRQIQRVLALQAPVIGAQPQEQ